MELGFTVSCYKGDLPLLRGCLASIRYFAADAPICLLIDQNFDSRPFEKRYGLTCIRRNDVKNPGLKTYGFGYGVTKMSALWEAPFEKVLQLDADLVLWGDIRKNLPCGNWDFVYNEPHELITEYIQKTQYFDPKKIFKFTRAFDWQGREYFNSGVFACRVGALDLNEALELLDILKNERGNAFPLNDQSVLNLLVFRMVSENRLNVSKAHLQSPVPVISREDLEKRFQLSNGKPVLWEKPTAIHWAGPKPYKRNPDVFSLPMDYFREIGMREFGLPKWAPAKTAMRADEIWHRDVPRAILNAKQIVKKMIGRN
jgi:hypothetical protein